MSRPPKLEHDLFDQLRVDAPPALVVFCVPVFLTYLSFYLLMKRWVFVARVLAVPALALFYIGADVAPVRCKALQAMLKFGVAIATMKLLDIHALSLFKSLPTYTSSPPPSPSIQALLLLTELRCESFTPNPIRTWQIPTYPFSTPSSNRLFYSEKVQFIIHLFLFAILQSLPQYPPVKALGVLISIWLIWTGIQLTLRYRTSPPLFGPLYLADNLATFWTETWHNAFAAPCLSLAYTPTTYLLTLLGLPRTVVRAGAVVSAFGFMALFHMYGMSPILSAEGRRRVGIFFVANGVCTVVETAVWGRRRDWRRAVLAWGIELGLASWTIVECEVADGLLNADWRGLCRADGA
ncbi:hypothetical protein DM02DRAFT_648235 [Periconia macrospinosa]|uniref:Wax synthase domain-containing protein n=1 Tax=Periconia macrospinosa TaxID=97972 RepID=A0A2V1EEP3_9PLEO|nr:hypothetical protein DM02DRAFT_648235 [Periconia macrospinosa]